MYRHCSWRFSVCYDSRSLCLRPQEYICHVLILILSHFSGKVVLDLAKELNVSVSWIHSVTLTCRLEIYWEKKFSLVHQEAKSWCKSWRKGNLFLRSVLINDNLQNKNNCSFSCKRTREREGETRKKVEQFFCCLSSLFKLVFSLQAKLPIEFQS